MTAVERDARPVAATDSLVANRILSIIAVALWAVLVIFVMAVVHDFFANADRAVYAAVDDSEAGIAYALAHTGRYAFPASPTLLGMSRMNGQFNYGPYYFYLAAGLIWLFGYSLTLVRSIHLWGVIACVLLAAWWFRGRARPAAAAFFGVALLWFFQAGQWPMVRPDSLVSVFAVAMLVAAGLAVERRGNRYWFLTGLFAACGAFTHLIAATLVVSAGAFLLAFVMLERLDQSGERRFLVRSSALAMGAGIAVGTFLFYASFHFDVAAQWRFLNGYREGTASGDVFGSVLARHLRVAFGNFAPWLRGAVWSTLAAGWIFSLVALRSGAATRRLVHGYVLLPTVTWTLYLISNGEYSNYHMGYAILHHVLFVWTATAEAWTVLRLLEERSPRATGWLIVAVAGTTLLFTSAQAVAQIAAPTRAGQGAKLVSFTEYSDHVLAGMPAGASAWGTILFGIESPDRLQLLQIVEPEALLPRLGTTTRLELAPDFLVFGYPEQRDDTLSVLRGSDTLLGRTAGLLPGIQYRLVSLVAGAPYGVTRVYARYVPVTNPIDPPPIIAAYDPRCHRWLSRVEAALDVPFNTVAPAVLRIGYGSDAPPAQATTTRAATLPAGLYLLRIRVRPGAGTTPRRMLAVTSASMLSQTIGELGPDGDFPPYFADASDVYAISAHSGGQLFVSQFDDGPGAAMEDITASPITGLVDAAEQPTAPTDPLPDLAKWTTSAGVHATAASGWLHVDGDATRFGYQVVSPRIPAGVGERVSIRLPSRVEAGKVCTGALDGTGARWIVAADTLRDRLEFTVDSTGGFVLVVANCRDDAEMRTSRFDIGPGDYTKQSSRMYADQFVSAVLVSSPARAFADPTTPGLRTMPAGLRIPQSVLDGPIEFIRPVDVSYQAPIVRTGADSWRIDGRASGAYTYLVRTKDRYLRSGNAVIVSGRIDHGGISVGLLRNDQWAAQLGVTTAGSFTAVVAPPGPAAYSIVVANNLSGDLNTSVTLTKVGVVSGVDGGREPKE